MATKSKPTVLNEAQQIARAEKLTKIVYPQPISNDRWTKYIQYQLHFYDESKVLKNRVSINVSKSIILSIALCLPYIGTDVMFAIVGSIRADSYVLLMLLFIFGTAFCGIVLALLYVAHKYAKEKLSESYLNGSFIFYSVYLFAVPIVLFVRSFFVDPDSKAIYPSVRFAPLYYLIVVLVFVGTVLTIIYLLKRKEDDVAKSVKHVLTMVLLPYGAGALIYLFSIFLRFLNSLNP